MHEQDGGVGQGKLRQFSYLKKNSKVCTKQLCIFSVFTSSINNEFQVNCNLNVKIISCTLISHIK